MDKQEYDIGFRELLPPEECDISEVIKQEEPCVS